MQTTGPSHMTTPNLRIGLVGAGQNTRERHIPGLRAIKGVEIVSVCNRRRESTERVAADFGIPQVYDDWRMLVGEAERVMASGRIFVERRTGADGQTREVTVPEHLDVIAEMACGAQTNFQISTVNGLDGPDGIWIFGENGTIHFARDRLMGGTRTDSRLSEIEIPPHEAGSWRVEEEFVGAIRGEEPVRLTAFEDGVRYMMFTAAVNKSLESGCREVVK